MSDQYRGTPPRRTPLYAGEYDQYNYDRYDDGRTAPHRGGEYYDVGHQYNRNGYTDYDRSALQVVRTSSSSYWPPPPRRRDEYYVDDEADEYYCSFNQPPPRRRGEFSDGRQRYRDDGYSYQCHPIQTISSYSRPSRPRSPPPPLRDVLSREVARGLQGIMPSLVEVGIAKFQQMAISMRREVQTPEVRVTVLETINRQAENEEAQPRQRNNQDINREEEGDETDERVNANADPQARLRNNRDGAQATESIN